VASLDVWCRIRVVNCCKRVLAAETLGGFGPPGLTAVDRVARLALIARRRRARIVISDISPRMRELLDLAGFDVRTWGWAPVLRTTVVHDPTWITGPNRAQPGKIVLPVGAPCDPGAD
jgi:hypothetical protein